MRIPEATTAIIRNACVQKDEFEPLERYRELFSYAGMKTLKITDGENKTSNQITLNEVDKFRSTGKYRLRGKDDLKLPKGHAEESLI